MARLRRSIALRMMVAMVLPVILLLIPAYFGFNQLELGHARSVSVSSDAEEVEIIAAVGQQVSSEPAQLRAYQRLLGDDQLIVYRGSRVIFRGPPNTDPRHFTVSAPFPGGRVVIVGDVESTARLSFEMTLIAGGALLVVAAAALVGARVASRSIRGPAERAATVAESVSSGDLSAKVGDVGPQEFARLATALDTMTARLEEADQAQRRFLADLAHEIATPVSSIASLATAVLDGTISDEQSRAEAGRLLDGETARLRGLLDDLAHLRNLDLAESVAFQRVELTSLLAEVAASFSPQAREAGVTLRGGEVGDPAEVDTDPRLVETVLGNLTSNAIRYTPPGGTVDLELRRRRDGIALVVRDTGIGIPKEEQSRIFDRFYRVEKSRGRAAGGTGLGLSIALRAAAAVGGRIEFDSEPDAGTEFRLVLPFEAPPDRGQGAGPEMRPRQPAGAGANEPKAG